MNTYSKKFAQIAVLSIGFAAANIGWSCQNKDGTEGPNAVDASKADGDEALSLSASDIYDLFHNPRLNKPDGLGDYVYDFQEK